MRELLTIFASVVEAGVPPKALINTLRTFAMSLRRMAEASRSLFRNHIEAPLLDKGLAPREMLAVAAPARVMLQRVGYRSAYLLQRRLYEEAVFTNLISRFEDFLSAAGASEPNGLATRAIGFVDLSGFTAIAETTGDASAAGLGLALLELVQAEVSRGRGELVKALGDGAMMLFRRPEEAVSAALRIVSLAREQDSTRSGRDCLRAGCFSRRRLLRQKRESAARLVGVARPSQVVVGQEVREAFSDRSLSFTPLGP